MKSWMIGCALLTALAACDEASMGTTTAPKAPSAQAATKPATGGAKPKSVARAAPPTTAVVPRTAPPKASAATRPAPASGGMDERQGMQAAFGILGIMGAAAGIAEAPMMASTLIDISEQAESDRQAASGGGSGDVCGDRYPRCQAARQRQQATLNRLSAQMDSSGPASSPYGLSGAGPGLATGYGYCGTLVTLKAIDSCIAEVSAAGDQACLAALQQSRRAVEGQRDQLIRAGQGMGLDVRTSNPC